MRRVTLSLPLVLLVCASSLGAQTAEPLSPAEVRGLPRSTLMASNMAIGAVTATVRAWRAKQPVRPALLGGAVGGAVMGSGLALGSGRFPAARLLSVQTVAIGASMARNAGSGVPLLSEVTLPFAPFIVTVGRADSSASPIQLRASAASLTAVAMRLGAGQGMRVDWRHTLGSGSVVFRTADPAFDTGVQCPPAQACSRAGSQRWGVVAYREGVSAGHAVRATLAHESMHVAQRARDLVLFGVPASDAVVRRGGRVGRTLSRYVVFDAFMPLRAVDALSEQIVGAAYRSWYEREARTYAPGSAGSFLRAPTSAP